MLARRLAMVAIASVNSNIKQVIRIKALIMVMPIFLWIMDGEATLKSRAELIPRYLKKGLRCNPLQGDGKPASMVDM